jgi:hypothetical protein
MRVPRPLVLVTLLYGVAAFVATLPAVLDFRSGFLSTGLPGYGEAATGDHLQTTYRFWLVGHQLEQGGAPWRDPYSYQPLMEPQFVLGGWPYGLPFWPLDALFGPVVAWNLLLLGSIVAAGLLTYLWLRELDLPPAAAATGGLVFAIAPYRLAQSGGHLLGWAAVFLPLALWAYERSCAASGRRRHAWGALCAAALASVPLSGQVHLALGAIPLLLAYAAVRFRPVPAIWAGAGVVAAVAAGVAIRETVIEGSEAAEGRSLEEVAAYSASWLDLLSRWRLDGLEEFVYVGWLTPVLAAAGLVLLVRKRPGLAAVLGLAAVVPLLLALGTNLPTYETLRDAFPPLRFPRVPGRLVPVADLALAGLAAFAVAWLLARTPRSRGLAVAALALALVAADLLIFPLRSSVADSGNKSYEALPEQVRILELPVFERGTGHFGSVYLHYTLQEPRERPTGYSLAPSSTFRFTGRFNRLDCGAWLPGDREELERLGIRSLFYHQGLYEQGRVPGAWFAWRGLEQAGYRPAARGGVVWLWEPGSADSVEPPVPEPKRTEPVLCDGWSAGALEDEEGALWVYGSGSARLALAADDPVDAVLHADGREADRIRVDGAATVDVPLEGSGWHPLVVEGAHGLRLVRVALA